MRQCDNHILTTRARSTNRRSGLSILEVLVSIGILVLGLLGVVALIPIAAQNLRRGMALDDATTVARSGLAEFQARGGNNIQKWLRYPPNPPGSPIPPVNGVMIGLRGIQTTSPTYSDLTPNPFYVAPTWAFCIDPMMYESMIVQDGANRDISYFPYQGNGAALDIPTNRLGQQRSHFGRMIRVTLNWNPSDWRNLAAATTQNLNVGLANSMCVSGDDLLLSTPGDGQLGLTVSQDESPASQFDVTMNSWDDPLFTPVKRNADGKMSWFATMVPLPGSVADGNRYYTLSIAVSERRDMVIDRNRVDLTSIGDQQQQDVESERTCGVRFIGGGLNGGEVQLVSYDPDLARGMKNLSRLREGNWILICGPGPDNPATNPALFPNDPSDRTGHIFYWYRIASIETDPQQIPLASPTQVVRNATLRGPDWPVGVSYSNFGATFDGEAIIPSNVINVFEHTIELRGE
jgi:hypothetical protein